MIHDTDKQRSGGDLKNREDGSDELTDFDAFDGATYQSNKFKNANPDNQAS